MENESVTRKTNVMVLQQRISLEMTQSLLCPGGGPPVIPVGVSTVGPE